MDIFMNMQVAMEATAKPPPASSGNNGETEYSGDASFDGELEKALDSQPDAETLALATEAVAVPFQMRDAQPKLEGEATETSETEAQAISARMSGWVEGQADSADTELIAFTDGQIGNEETGQAAKSNQAGQSSLDALVEPATNEQLPQVVIPNSTEKGDSQGVTGPVNFQASQAGAEEQLNRMEVTQTLTNESQNNQSLGQTNINQDTVDVNGAQAAADSTLLETANEGDEGKVDAPVTISKGNNDPSTPDIQKEAAQPTLDETSLDDTTTSSAKNDGIKSKVSVEQNATTVSLNTNSTEVEETQSQETISAQAPVSESRKVKPTFSSTEGDSSPPLNSGNGVVQQQGLDTQLKEPARLAEARSTEMINQVSKGIDALSRSDGQSIRIQLYPESLGKIDIRLSTGSDGVSVSLSSDLQLTGDLLERHISELRTSLADAGVNLSSLTVNSGQQQASYQGMRQEYAGKNTRSSYINQNINVNEEQPSVKIFQNDSAIDYRV